MNDPKTLQIIAEKACQFDRTHFSDGCEPEPDTMLRHHEKLETDPKLITRLHVRYAVTLGFFEGYALAIEDGDELRRERDKLQTKLAEAERTGAEHAAQLENEIRTLVAERDRYKREMMESKNANPANADVYAWVMQSKYVPFFETGFGPADLANALNDFRREFAIPNDPKNIGIVIKPPPPPPPPAAPPPPNELRTEIDDELAQAAAEYANDEEGYPTTARDIDEVHDAMKDGKGWYAIARAFVHGALWQLSRIENAHAGDDPTMHFPPAFDRAPIPSDREIAELVCRTIYSGTETSEAFIRRIADEIKGDDPESVRRKVAATYGSASEACAIKFALLHFRDRLVGPANRSSIPSDEEIARFCVRWIGPHWDSRDLRSAREDLANPEHHVSHATAMRAALDHFGGWSNRPANEVQNAERTQYETTIRQKNERIAELEKELALSMETIAATAACAAVWRDHTELCDYASAEIARNALIRVRNSVDLLPYNFGGVPKSPVMDAIEEELANLKTQEAKHDDGQSVPKKREARIDHVLTTNPGISIAESVRVAQSFDLPNAKISSSLPLPIVFRDDAESDYWEEMSCVLATKKDATSQSVATAADEMIEERRKRLPSVATSNVVQRAMAVADLLRKQDMHVAAVNRIVDGKSRSAIAFGHEQTTLVFVDRPRHDRMQTEDVADEVVDSYELSRQHVVDLPAESDEIVGLTNRIVDLEDTIEWVQKRLAKMLGREDLPLVGESLDAIEIAIAQKEYDDELLLEAASFANASERFTSPDDRLPKSKELEHAKKAIREDHTSTWYRVCRAYVNGALRSSRNP